VLLDALMVALEEFRGASSGAAIEVPAAVYSPRACRRPRHKQLLLPSIARQRRRPLELSARFFEEARLEEQLATRAGQQVVALQSRLLLELVDESTSGSG
jgi:hypothetical protein